MSGDVEDDTGALFRVVHNDESEVLLPERGAASGWSATQMRGMAISGALGRSVEQSVQALRRPDLAPVRWTLDLFRAAQMVPCTASARVLRAGRRLCLVEAVLEQEGQPVARASALYLRREHDTPAAQGWSPARELSPPPKGMVPERGQGRLYFSDGEGWTSSAAAHFNDSRKQMWLFARPVVLGEALSPFLFAVTVADVASVVTNWARSGLEYINADFTLALTREPSGSELGLVASDRTTGGGVSTSTATMFDRDGVLGSVLVCALANADRAVDPATRLPRTQPVVPAN